MIELLQASDTTYRLGWTLLNSLWLGAAVAAALAAILAMLRDRASHLRYAAACAALLLLLAAMAWTFSLVPPRPEIPHVQASMMQPEGDATAVLPPVPVNPVVSLPTAKRDATGGAVSPEPHAAVASTDEPLAAKAQKVLEPALPWIVLGWTLGVLILSVWQLSVWMAARRLCVVATQAVDKSLLEMVQRLKGRLRISRPVRVMRSMLAQVPMTIGWIRPVILLPASLATGLSTSQLETLLVHELAHIRRLDYLVNLVQTFIETLMFYHPAVWYIGRRIRAERENCCDDMVVQVCGGREEYAHALMVCSGAGAQLAMAASGGQLLPRIRRILGLSNSSANPSALLSAGLALILIVAMVIVPMACMRSTPNATPLKAAGATTTDGDAFAVVRIDRVGEGLVGRAMLVGRINGGKATMQEVPLSKDVERWDTLGVVGTKAYLGQLYLPQAQQIKTLDLDTGAIGAFTGGAPALRTMGIAWDPTMRAGSELWWDGQIAGFALYLRSADGGSKKVWGGGQFTQPVITNVATPLPPVVWLDDRHVLTVRVGTGLPGLTDGLDVAPQYILVVVDIVDGKARDIGGIPWSGFIQLVAPRGNDGDALVILNGGTASAATGKSLARTYAVNARAAINGAGNVQERPAQWGAFTVEGIDDVYSPTSVSVRRLACAGKELAKDVVVSVSPDGRCALWQVRPKNPNLDGWDLNLFEAGGEKTQKVGRGDALGMPVWFTSTPSAGAPHPSGFEQGQADPLGEAKAALAEPGSVQSDWGPAEQGVQIRARALRTVWTADQLPQFVVDKRTATVPVKEHWFNNAAWDLEVDGKWYHSFSTFAEYHAPPYELPPKSLTDERFSPADYWDLRRIDPSASIPLAEQAGGERLVLIPGKHTVRVAYRFDTQEVGKSLRVASGAMEIEVEPAAAKPAASSKPVVKDGLQVTVTLPKTTFAADEPPKFTVQFKNVSNKPIALYNPFWFWDWSIQFEDQATHGPWKLSHPSGAAAPFEFAAGPCATYVCNPGQTMGVTVDLGGLEFPYEFTWAGRVAGQPILPLKQLKPGKYRLTIAIPLKADMGKRDPAFWAGTITTAPVDFQISDKAAATQPVPWGDVVDGFQLRLQPEKAIWKKNANEPEAHTLDLGHPADAERYIEMNSALHLDIRNTSNLALPLNNLGPNYEFVEIEYDGKLYDYFGGMAPKLGAVQPGDTINTSLFPREGDLQWGSYPDFKPGAHTIRMVLAYGDDKIFSNPITVEIAASQSVATAPAAAQDQDAVRAAALDKLEKLLKQATPKGWTLARNDGKMQPNTWVGVGEGTEFVMTKVPANGDVMLHLWLMKPEYQGHVRHPVIGTTDVTNWQGGMAIEYGGIDSTSWSGGYHPPEDYPWVPVRKAVARVLLDSSTNALTAGASTTPAMAPAMTEEQVVAEVEKLGGDAKREGDGFPGLISATIKPPEGPVVYILFNPKSGEGVTDAVLEHLKGLTQLKQLWLQHTKVTDAGLEYLKGLNRLQILYLDGTSVTDAGLEHLKGLKQLQFLSLRGTKVTDQGVQGFQEALPKCDVFLRDDVGPDRRLDTSPTQQPPAATQPAAASDSPATVPAAQAAPSSKPAVKDGLQVTVLLPKSTFAATKSSTDAPAATMPTTDPAGSIAFKDIMNLPEKGQQKMADGLVIEDLKVGTGKSPTDKDTVVFHWTVWLKDGTKVDSSRNRGDPMSLQVDAYIKGFQEGLKTMKVGGRRKLTIPPELAYGVDGGDMIPPNAVLIFDIELLAIK